MSVKGSTRSAYFPAAVIFRDKNGKQETAPPSRIIVDCRTSQPVPEAKHQRPGGRRGKGLTDFDDLHLALIGQIRGGVVDHAKERAIEGQHGMVIQPAFVARNPLALAGNVARAENQGFEIARHFAGIIAWRVGL